MFYKVFAFYILGDPGADSGDEEKSKRTEKYGMKKSKENLCFSGTNQKPERWQPFGTGLVQFSKRFTPSVLFPCYICHT